MRADGQPTASTEDVTPVPHQRRRVRWATATARRSSRGLTHPAVLIAPVVVLAAVLRLDALVGRYGWLDHPAWARGVEHGAATIAQRLRPSVVHWQLEDPPYLGGDPQNYIRFARQMQHFYAAHVREPMFPFATKVFLWLLANQEVGVSFASALFSVLAVVATYLLGKAAYGQPVGLLAALAMAVEYDAIAWSVDGWRDTTFTFFVTATAWAFVRLYGAPTGLNAALAGLAAAGACLTRITSLSFVVPGFLVILLAGRGRTPSGRPRTLAAMLLALALVAPFLINCAVATGDPFFSINYHTVYYRAAEGFPPGPPTGALDYLAEKVAARPVKTLESAALGLTSHPFGNKWNGFNAWQAGLGRFLAALALAGLALFTFAPNGRLLLLLLGSSLVPYVFTWNVGGGGEWRFTQHTYPFYLVAAALALTSGGQVLGRIGRQPPARWLRVSRAQLAQGAILAGLAGLVWLLLLLTPYLREREALLAGEPAMIVAGARDLTFFGEGWRRAVSTGNVTARFAAGLRGSLRVPLPERRRYRLTFRLDPPSDPGQPQQVVSVLVNHALVARFKLTWNPERVGSYTVVLPAALARPRTRIDLVSDRLVTPRGRSVPGLADDDVTAFRLWYLRITPM